MSHGGYVVKLFLWNRCGPRHIPRPWRRRPLRCIGSEIAMPGLIGLDVKMSRFVPTRQRRKFASVPRARQILLAFHAGQPSRQRRTRRDAGAHGCCQPEPHMMIPSCGFGSRAQISGTGRQRRICEDLNLSLPYALLMLNSNDGGGSGVRR